MAFVSLLEDRAIIALKGAETRNFLQGLITNDMAACVEGHGIYAALLAAQGKILFDFFIAPSGKDEFLLDSAAARLADLTKRLTMYRLRAKVEIAHRPDLSVAAIWGDEAKANPEAEAITFTDPRHPALGLRAIGTREALAAIIREAEPAGYHAHRLLLGVPDSADLPPDQVFALDAGMEELKGVDFKKGCYVGQEVTSRMKHRATARRRFLVAETAGDIPPPGTPLQSEGREIGTLATGTGGRAMALVRLDRFAEAEEKRSPITAAGRVVTLKKPEWFGA